VEDVDNFMRLLNMFRKIRVYLRRKNLLGVWFFNKKVIVHIGRHKTGNSSLQGFLDENRKELERYGVCYPEVFLGCINHHPMAQAISRRALGSTNDNVDFDNIPQVSAVRKAILESSCDTVLLSSEGFQNTKPASLRRALEGFDVNIIVYLRDQDKSLASSYAQRVHATNYSGTLDDFYNNNDFAMSDYERFLLNWESEFPGKINVSKYSRKSLVEGDVVYDFCKKMLSISPSTIKRRFIYNKRDRNPSLTASLISFKCRLNKLLPDDYPEKAAVYWYFSNLARASKDDSYKISDHYLQVVRRKHRKSNRAVNKLYSLDLETAAPTVDSNNLNIYHSDLNDEEYSLMLALLIDEIPSMQRYV
jgi:hypothetical protein